MAADEDREAQYDQIRERFLADPEFRAEMRADAVGTLTGVLGELTEQERQWVRELPDASTSEEELVDQVTTQRVGAW